MACDCRFHLHSRWDRDFEVSTRTCRRIEIYCGGEVLTECVCTGIVINASDKLWRLSGIDT